MKYRVTIRLVGKELREQKAWQPLTKVGEHTEYGYAPPEKFEVDASRDVYEQEFDTDGFDLAAIVRILNGSPE